MCRCSSPQNGTTRYTCNDTGKHDVILPTLNIHKISLPDLLQTFFLRQLQFTLCLSFPKPHIYALLRFKKQKKFVRFRMGTRSTMKFRQKSNETEKEKRQEKRTKRNALELYSMRSNELRKGNV